MKAYCTEKNILVTEKTLNIYKSFVFGIPIVNRKQFCDKRKYYLSIANFLQHLICSATVSKNTEKRARFKGNKKWTYSVPFPYELGIEVTPEVFMQSRDLPFDRALEVLENSGLIKIIDRDFSTKKCREFSLSQNFLKQLFPEEREKYLLREDRYTYLTDIYNKRGGVKKIDAILKNNKLRSKVKNYTSERNVKDLSFRNLLKDVYSKIETIPVNIDALMTYCNQNPTPINMGYYYNFITHLCSTESKIVSLNPLIVKYKQGYKSAKLGGRSFEVGTGYQYLPKEMKKACLASSYNYDIKNCQLEILRNEFKKLDISDRNLKKLDTRFIINKLGIDDEHAKEIRFATIFNGGNVSLSPRTGLYKKIKSILGEKKTRIALGRWKKLMKPLRKDLELLAQYYISTGRKNRCFGLFVKNAVGQNFNCTYKESGVKRQPQQMRRKLLAHMIQGLESRAVYDYARTHSGVRIGTRWVC
ncbi:hypothetical protein I5375_23385 [Citrobacter freundii]|nr:hypothetical protein [Citrobacter freundii]